MLRTLCLSAALGLAGGGALFAATDGFQAYTTQAARRIAVQRHPVAVPAVALQAQSGARTDFAALRGRWVLVDFIYTRCLSYCLASGSEFAQLQDRFAAAIAERRLELVSISIDPLHDTPQALAAYLRRSRARSSGWLAARPLAEEGARELRRAFGITVIADGAGGYVHDAALGLVDPRGRLVAILDAGDVERAERELHARLAR